MSRLNMVIADSDMAYTERLSAWFMSNYPNRLNLEIYTQKELLLDCLTNNEIYPDIILISSKLMPSDKSSLSCETVIILCDSSTPNEFEQCYCINKYQPADKLFNQIIDYYYEMREDAVHIIRGNSKTRIINIFSPQGNSGKTTISAIFARELARLGFKTLYISFRSINCTNILPLTENTQNNFSKLIYYIKQNSSNLSIKISTLVSYDQETSLSYLLTPDSCLELDELNPQDISKLLLEITASGIYDYIVTITDTSLTHKTLTLMECANVVLIPAIASRHLLGRLNFLEKEIKKIRLTYHPEISDNFLILLNKSFEDVDTTIYPYPVLACLPNLEKIEMEKHIVTSKLEGYIKPVVTKLISLMDAGDL